MVYNDGNDDKYINLVTEKVKDMNDLAVIKISMNKYYDALNLL